MGVDLPSARFVVEIGSNSQRSRGRALESEWPSGRPASACPASGPDSCRTPPESPCRSSAEISVGSRVSGSGEACARWARRELLGVGSRQREYLSPGRSGEAGPFRNLEPRPHQPTLLRSTGAIRPTEPEFLLLRTP